MIHLSTPSAADLSERVRQQVMEVASRALDAQKPRKRAPGGGRKRLLVPKVRLECRVLPQTKRALGDKPGEKLDALVAREGRI